MPVKRKKRKKQGNAYQLPNLNKLLASLNPDPYAGINWDDLNAQVDEQVQHQMDPMVNSISRARAQGQHQFQVASQEAQGWQLALAKLFTGGKPGAEGMAHSQAEFGGSYLPGIAATEGTKLLAQISRDFQENDWKLVDELTRIYDEEPALRDQIRKNLVDERLQGNLASFQNRLALASLVLDDYHKRQAEKLANAQFGFDQMATVTRLGQGQQRINQSERRLRLDQKRTNRELELSAQRVGISRGNLKVAQEREARLAKAQKKGGGAGLNEAQSAWIDAGVTLMSMREDVFGDEGEGGLLSGKKRYPNRMTYKRAVAYMYQTIADSLTAYGYKPGEIKGLVLLKLRAMGFPMPKGKANRRPTKQNRRRGPD